MIAIQRSSLWPRLLAIAFYLASVAGVLLLFAADVAGGLFAAALLVAAAAHVVLGWVVGWRSLAFPLTLGLLAIPVNALGIDAFREAAPLLVGVPAGVVLVVTGIGARTALARSRAGRNRLPQLSRLQWLALGFYLAAVAALVFGAPSRAPDAVAILVLVAAVLAHLVAGFAFGWWSLALPAYMVVLAVPAEALNTDPSREIPMWFVALVWATPALVLLVIGACARAYVRRRRQPPTGRFGSHQAVEMRCAA
jgi:hypothetical protein